MNFLPTVLNAALAAASSYTSRPRRDKPSREQKQQSQTIDQILGSMTGEGPYSGLFNLDEEAFQKSYVDPTMQIFRDQVAPQIQQQYIASGQQRGTGLEDTLSRAGVSMQQMLNQQYMNFLEKGKDRQFDFLKGYSGRQFSPQQRQRNPLTGGFFDYLSGSVGEDDIGRLLQQLLGR